jgi:TDG/mug DNA glycosylase family protein
LNSYEPDILTKGLDVVFCGLNPASTAAAAGHNFSNENNRFWLVLHLAGFTDVRLQPRDERRLLDYGCGITAVVRRPTKSADEISLEEFRQARRGFESKMLHYAPRSIAFLGKRAVSAMIGRSDVRWGRLPTGYAQTMTWILPNPSGRNRSFALDALVSAYSEFRLALAAPGAPPFRSYAAHSWRMVVIPVNTSGHLCDRRETRTRSTIAIDGRVNRGVRQHTCCRQTHRAIVRSWLRAIRESDKSSRRRKCAAWRNVPEFGPYPVQNRQTAMARPHRKSLTQLSRMAARLRSRLHRREKHLEQ